MQTQTKGDQRNFLPQTDIGTAPFRQMQKGTPLTGKENNPARKKSGDAFRIPLASSYHNRKRHTNYALNKNTTSNSRYITGSGFDGDVSRSDFKASNVDGDDGNTEEINSMLEANGVSSLIPKLSGSEMETDEQELDSRSDFKMSDVDGDDGNSEDMNSMLEANGVSSLIPKLSGSEMETDEQELDAYTTASLLILDDYTQILDPEEASSYICEDTTQTPNQDNSMDVSPLFKIPKAKTNFSAAHNKRKFEKEEKYSNVPLLRKGKRNLVDIIGRTEGLIIMKVKEVYKNGITSRRLDIEEKIKSRLDNFKNRVFRDLENYYEKLLSLRYVEDENKWIVEKLNKHFTMCINHFRKVFKFTDDETFGLVCQSLRAMFAEITEVTVKMFKQFE